VNAQEARATQTRDPQVISKAMRAVRGRDTSPEVSFRRAIWREGLRYRLHDSRLPGKPDIVFPSARLAVFIAGDFWHGNQFQRRGHASLEEQFAGTPAEDYWVPKIQCTMERDRLKTAEVVAKGWRALRLWENQVATDLAGCVDLTKRAVLHQAEETSLPGLPERTVAEFFAGIGLVRLALERHGWTVRFANDIDPAKHEMYSANFTDDPPEQYGVEDIHKLRADDVPTVTLATASFPCTDLSLAGARNGLAGTQSGALLGFFDLLEGLGDRRPPIVMLENVPGFLTSHKGADFHYALSQLNSMGYAVDTFTLDAVRFVPQSRSRLFVIGVRDDPEGGDPVESVRVSTVRPKAVVDRIQHESDVRWRIVNLPEPPTSRPENRATLGGVLEDIPTDSEWWWSEDRTEYLVSQMSEKHRRLAQALSDGAGVRHGTVFRRIRHGRSMAELRADGIAGCLRTPRGGSSRQILLVTRNGGFRARFLTPRECARLQGAPDSYPVDHVHMNQAFFGFGDAVCVPVIEWIVEHYLNPLVSQLLRGRVLTQPVTH